MLNNNPFTDYRPYKVFDHPSRHPSFLITSLASLQKYTITLNNQKRTRHIFLFNDDDIPSVYLKYISFYHPNKSILAPMLHKLGY